jgi:hypothetical protein
MDYHTRLIALQLPGKTLKQVVMPAKAGIQFNIWIPDRASLAARLSGMTNVLLRARRCT